jgi:hypothetical protein
MKGVPQNKIHINVKKSNLDGPGFEPTTTESGGRCVDHYTKQPSDLRD